MFLILLVLNIKLETTTTLSPRRRSHGLHNPDSSHDQIQCLLLAEVRNFTNILIDYLIKPCLVEVKVLSILLRGGARRRLSSGHDIGKVIPKYSCLSARRVKVDSLNKCSCFYHLCSGLGILRPGQDNRHVAHDIFNYIFWNWKKRILKKIIAIGSLVSSSCIKWPSLRRRHFQMHFYEWKILYFDSNFTEICSCWSNWQ